MISVLFSNGHNRILDFDRIFKYDWKTTEKDFEYKLLKLSEFKKVKLEGFTFSWTNVKIAMTNFDGKKIKVPFDVGADTFYELSEPDKTRMNIPVASIKSGIF